MRSCRPSERPSPTAESTPASSPLPGRHRGPPLVSRRGGCGGSTTRYTPVVQPRNDPPEGPASRRRNAESEVDVGLIRWMLSLGYEERLEALQNQANALMELRDAAQGR